MHHQLNANYHSFYVKQEKAKKQVMTKITRSSSIDLKQILYSLPSKTANTPLFRENLKSRSRSFSNSASMHDQDSNEFQDSNITQTDGPIQFQNKQQRQLNDRSSRSMPSSNTTNTNRQQEEPNNIYENRKGDVNFRQFHQNFQQDVLQLEALYYQLSQLGFQRSTPLQLPPILNYTRICNMRRTKKTGCTFYILQLCIELINNPCFQFYETYFQDDYYIKLKTFYSGYFKEKLQNQCFSQISFYSNPEDSILFEHILFQNVTNLIPNLNLDYNMLLDDFLSYFSLSNLQKKSIECSVIDENVFRKNNIAFGNIRFVFKQQDGLLLDFKQPIGKFENKQFLDYVQFQAEFAQQISSVEPIKSFNSCLSKPHSERTLILFLLADLYLNQSIFQDLNIDLVNSKQKNNIINLLEITSENRVCNKYVGMFQYIPIEFICEKFQETIGLGVDTGFIYWIPNNRQKKKDTKRIWVRTLEKKINQQQLSKDQEKNQVVIQKQKYQEIPSQLSSEQKEYNDCELVQKQDLEQQVLNKKHQQEAVVPQEQLLCYEEQEPTGLISVLFLKERYCKSEYSNFKTKIPDIKITNTFSQAMNHIFWTELVKIKIQTPNHRNQLKQ